MATVYDYLKANKGVLAIQLDCEPILRQFKFTDETADLKKAVEKAADECLATYVVDALLNCSEPVINEFIDVLNNTDQSGAVSWFAKYCIDPDIFLEKYLLIKNCEPLISDDVAKKLQENNSQIRQILQENGAGLITTLYDVDAISRQMHTKLNSVPIEETYTLLLDMIRSQYQYDICRQWAKTNCPLLLQYL